MGCIRQLQFGIKQLLHINKSMYDTLTTCKNHTHHSKCENTSIQIRAATFQVEAGNLLELQLNSRLHKSLMVFIVCLKHLVHFSWRKWLFWKPTEWHYTLPSPFNSLNPTLPGSTLKFPCISEPRIDSPK